MQTGVFMQTGVLLQTGVLMQTGVLRQTSVRATVKNAPSATPTPALPCPFINHPRDGMFDCVDP